MRSMYFDKDLGDDTRLKVVRIQRPDDGVPAMALQFCFENKVLSCFLENNDGVSYIDELTEALVLCMEDMWKEQKEESERKAKEHLLRKELENVGSVEETEIVNKQ